MLERQLGRRVGLERVADALGEPGDGTADGSRAVRAVQRVLADIGFPTLTDVGVTADDLRVAIGLGGDLDRRPVGLRP